jgi:hypothetical protein
MKNIYDITKGQLLTCWFFGLNLIFIGRFILKMDDSPFLKISLMIGVSFLLVFYTLGWRNYKKNNPQK